MWVLPVVVWTIQDAIAITRNSFRRPAHPPDTNTSAPSTTTMLPPNADPAHSTASEARAPSRIRRTNTSREATVDRG